MKMRMQNTLIEKTLFTGKKSIPWDEVENYLKRYYGCIVTIDAYQDAIHLGSAFADEYTGSKYTKSLRGQIAKVKANLVQVLPEVIATAVNRREVDNKSEKHRNDAGLGWYRYDIFFSVKVRAEDETDYRINRYRGTLVVRKNDMGLYAHDIINIKKEASMPRESS